MTACCLQKNTNTYKYSKSWLVPRKVAARLLCIYLYTKSTLDDFSLAVLLFFAFPIYTFSVQSTKKTRALSSFATPNSPSRPFKSIHRVILWHHSLDDADVVAAVCDISYILSARLADTISKSSQRNFVHLRSVYFLARRACLV